jgi:hypothetical protein
MTRELIGGPCDGLTLDIDPLSRSVIIPFRIPREAVFTPNPTLADMQAMPEQPKFRMIVYTLTDGRFVHSHTK